MPLVGERLAKLVPCQLAEVGSAARSLNVRLDEVVASEAGHLVQATLEHQLAVVTARLGKVLVEIRLNFGAVVTAEPRRV
jgi:hypothetical protein